MPCQLASPHTKLTKDVDIVNLANPVTVIGFVNFAFRPLVITAIYLSITVIYLRTNVVLQFALLR